MEDKGRVGHAVVVPYPGQGHINPIMHFSKKLASHGFTVTFVLTESWHKNVTRALSINGGCDAFTDARRLGLDIRPGCIPDCVIGESERWACMEKFYLSLANMESHVSHLITNLSRSESPPTCIVTDVFLKWAVPLAKQHALQSVSLWTQSATGASIFFHRHFVRVEGPVDYKNIPGVPPLEWRDLSTSENSVSTALSDEIDRCVANVKETDWIVTNSFYALESRAVEALWPKIPLLCVGPLMPSAYLERSDCRDRNVGTSYLVETGCTDWLDSKPPRSVIYVSFGSLVSVSRAQVCELALGFMESGYYFLWVLRPSKEVSDIAEMLPPGFLEESKEKGLVVPWVRQLEVLSHPTVGGFVSHCGWNAVMESVSSGVPMLGFPVGNDQFLNCKLLVEEWKFGLRLGSRDEENKVIGRQEITRRVKVLMEGEDVRREAVKFRDAAKEEVSKGGRSWTNLEALVNGLKAKSL